MTFNELVASIPQIGKEWHSETILRNSARNAPYITRTIREIPADERPALVVSAGPSLYRQRSLSRLGSFSGTVIATDGSYIQCLKAGITPDFVVTLDPHPTRVIRWFGDPNIRENSHEDSYFQRQDLDAAFRNVTTSANEENIRLVDENRVPLIICTSSPANVVARTTAFPRYWFMPLVDSPVDGSLTKEIYEAARCPALNTGGTVGTAAWNFAHSILRSSDIAIVGADYGYYDDLPLEQTQEWEMLKDESMFPLVDTPFGKCRTSPTYFWYAQNFRDLLKSNGATLTNCSEHGILHGDGISLRTIEQWLLLNRLISS